MTSLSVNLNKIALLRNSRGGQQPHIEHFAESAIQAGATGITVHPRPDGRHTLPSDVATLATFLAESSVEFNIEGNPFGPETNNSFPGFMAIVRQHLPTQCTLVPDTVAQLTSNHGFNLFCDAKKLRPIISELKDLGIRSSLFMDPDLEQITLAGELKVDRIELYTGPYAEAFARQQDDISDSASSFNSILEGYAQATEHAQKIGIGVNAGHDLNQLNLSLFLQIPNILEVSIGHALICEALEHGFSTTVQRYSAIIARSESR